MTTGVWEPGGAGVKVDQVSQELLDRFVACAREIEDSVSADLLASHDLAGHKIVMNLEDNAWEEAERLPTEDLEALVRLFTLVEMQVAGWDAGRKSPVIALVRLLKARDAFDPTLRKWIKSSTTNRYLPNGSAL